MMNKKAQQHKQYVVQTYTSWTEPQHRTFVVTLNELAEVQKYTDEVLTIHELGKEVKLKVQLA
jgi:hypothetical protein